MRKHLFSLILGVALSACTEDQRTIDEQRNKIESEQQSARKREEREAQRKIDEVTFSDPSKAEIEISRRIDAWIMIEEGTVLIKNARGGIWHAVAAKSAWAVTCNKGQLSIRIGPWVVGDKDDTDSLIASDLVYTKLSDSQCRFLVRLTARKLQKIFVEAP